MYSFLSKCKSISRAFFQKKIVAPRCNNLNFVCINSLELGNFVPENNDVSGMNYDFYSKMLENWYEEHRRDLPWRRSSDPYIIWISEVILQQTRVVQGLDYFNRFVARFPDVRSLAAASEDEVLKYWQGLGYYSRARNLLEAARMVCRDFGGIFPRTYEGVRSLKGVGDYTAAAIVSFAYDLPYPVLDGNVYRVLARLFALPTPIDSTQGKKEFAELAALLLDREHPGLYNQAIMELGALQCVPHQPNCSLCPLNKKCMAYATGEVSAFPVKQQKTKSRPRYFHYLHIVCGNDTYLQRREGKDIWRGLYQFPLIETHSPSDFSELQQSDAFRCLLSDCGRLEISLAQRDVKHVLSHQTLYASFYYIKVERESEALREYLRVPLSGLENYAFPRLILRYLQASAML